RSQFSLCTEKFITLSDVPDVDICLRKASHQLVMDKGFLNAHANKSAPQNDAYV
ncbi:unnamed protein product, partial [Macrosiphum euphorbiae]